MRATLAGTLDWTRVLRSETLYVPGSTGFGRCPIGTGNFHYGSCGCNAFARSV